MSLWDLSKGENVEFMTQRLLIGGGMCSGHDSQQTVSHGTGDMNPRIANLYAILEKKKNRHNIVCSPLQRMGERIGFGWSIPSGSRFSTFSIRNALVQNKNTSHRI